MLKKLRVKFIALNMATVTVVLMVVFSAICYLDYRQSVKSVHAALDAAIERTTGWPATRLDGFALGDRFGGSAQDPEPNPPFAGNDARDMAPSGDGFSEETDDGLIGGTPLEIGGHRDGYDRVIPVAVYMMLDKGLLEMAPQGSTAILSDEVLAQAAALLADAPDGAGELGGQGLHYAKRTTPFGTYLAFADVSAVSSWQQLALLLCGVGALALVVFLVISMFFSRWALRPVERAWAQQQQFVADASHELKTPLTVILANTAILREHPERSVASQGQWVESTQVEAERMQELVCDMLELAQPNGVARKKDACSPVNLANVVKQEVLQFESVAFERKVAIREEVLCEATLAGDEGRLHRLVSTLIDNACKYSKENGMVTVRLVEEGRFILFSVHNEGEAISPEDVPHVFDRFYRADKARTHEAGSQGAGSYGLGLAIAREVAEQHGGSISVASSPDAGTTFTVRLPV
ncbi:MAG: HAMP domain-containing histidine kinase [Eggerthellaceae bacterium]|nr:HAMP domain-containing histidine kinase [Eggerthellaceae bacterium]